MDYDVTKSTIIAALLCAGLSTSFAQSATPDPAASAATATTPAPKRHKLHAPKLRKGATAASNAETSPFKQGGQ